MALVYSIEDDESIRELLSCACQSANISFEGFETYSEFEKGLLKQKPELILLDIMLPELDGISILKKLKASQNERLIPVIMLSAKNREAEKVLAFELGADDYVAKPFGVFELVARIKAVIRRNQRGTKCVPPSELLSVAGIDLDEERHEVRLEGKDLELTNKEFLLLKVFMINPNIVLTRERLLDVVWGYDFLGETRTVDMHVMSLRQKMGEGAYKISTVRGVGYKFVT